MLQAIFKKSQNRGVYEFCIALGIINRNRRFEDEERYEPPRRARRACQRDDFYGPEKPSVVAGSHLLQRPADPSSQVRETRTRYVGRYHHRPRRMGPRRLHRHMGPRRMIRHHDYGEEEEHEYYSEEESDYGGGEEEHYYGEEEGYYHESEEVESYYREEHKDNDNENFGLNWQAEG